MNTSEENSEVLSAYCSFQDDVENPEKNKTVKVKTDSGKNYSYDYATLDALVEKIQKTASEHGLSFSQEVVGDTSKIEIYTYLFHESGQWVEFGPLSLKVERNGRMNNSQAAGSTITYARRYALAAMAGIASEEDTDTQEIKGGQGSSNQNKNDDYSDLPDTDGSISDSQQELIFNLFSDQYDLETEMADDFVGSIKQKYIEDLSMQEASNLISLLKQKEDKAEKMIENFKNE